MLVISRLQNEGIRIGDDIRIVVVQSGGKVRIGIDAPPAVQIWRDELYDAIKERKQSEKEDTDS